MFFKFSRLAALRRRFRTARLAALCFRWRFPAAAEALCATFRCGALAHARFAALWRRSRLRPARRPLFPAAVSGGGKGSLCDLSAALPPAPGSPLCGGALAHARLAALCFRRRQRLFVRPSGGALAHARFAASVRRSRSRPVRRFVAALSLTLGSPLCGSALARARLAVLCFRRRFTAAAKALCATFRRRSRSRSVRRPLFRCGGFRRRSRLRPVRRFVAALSLAPGSPLCGGAPARARLPLCGGALAHARFAALRRRSRSRSARRPFCPCLKPCSKNARALFLSTGSRLKYP